MIRNHGINGIVIKGAEGLAARGRPFVERVEMEGVAQAAAAQEGIVIVPRKVKSTIAKDIGLKGKPKYLSTADMSAFPEFATYSSELQDAVLAAYSATH